MRAVGVADGLLDLRRSLGLPHDLTKLVEVDAAERLLHIRHAYHRARLRVRDGGIEPQLRSKILAHLFCLDGSGLVEIDVVEDGAQLRGVL